MVDTADFPHHPVLEELSEVLCARTEREAAPFFRTLAIYYLGLMASCMRAKIQSEAFKELPVNNYVIALATSGFGKGKSTGIMEDEILCDFRMCFRDYVMQDHAYKSMTSLASRFAALSGRTEAHEMEKLEKDFAACGEYPFVFDGGSEAAIKQVRQMLILANCGSLNLQIDEIGTNLEKAGTTESMAAFLELYDTGRIKNKVKMNTSENKRAKEVEGITPSNMLLFGTQHRLLDSGPLEKKWMALLETGYARRCLFAWADDTSAMSDETMTEDEIYERLTNPVNEAAIQKWRQHFASLADPSKIGWTISSSEAVDKLLIRYKLDCRAEMLKLSEFDTIRRTELENRYSRALKVAGTLAFVDESLVLTEDHIKSAIKLVEESGKSFQSMMSREPVQAKLARFIASAGRELTVSELTEELPFFKAVSKGERTDMLSLAQGWGYKSHTILRKRFNDGIELYSGEMLKETKLSALQLSHSGDFAHHYESVEASFEDLEQLATMPDHQWAAHGFVNQHRTEENAIPGFDLLVFDIDGTASLDLVHDLFADYAHMTYTTKRHTPAVNRFRLVLPMNYELKLDGADYREFYRNVMEWLPFEVDASTFDRSRKWATYENAQTHLNRGQLLDILPFIPRTKRNEEHKREAKELGSLDNLERWFAQRIAEGSRNNNMIKFALALADSGMDYNEIEQRVLSFNAKLSNGLPADELHRTVLVTVAKRLQNAA